MNEKEEKEYTELLRKMDLKQVYKNRLTARQRLEQLNEIKVDFPGIFTGRTKVPFSNVEYVDRKK